MMRSNHHILQIELKATAGRESVVLLYWCQHKSAHSAALAAARKSEEIFCCWAGRTTVDINFVCQVAVNTIFDLLGGATCVTCKYA
jgi:hypothetical protein